jgi:transposase
MWDITYYVLYLPVSLSTVQHSYDCLDRPALIQLVQEKDRIIADGQQDLLLAVEKIGELSRILNLRNKKLFGSSSEKSNRLLATGPSDYIEFEEVSNSGTVEPATKEGSKDGKPLAKKQPYSRPHPGRYAIPAHIPRQERHIYPEGYAPSWKRELPAERTERLSLKIELIAEVTIRHKYAREEGFVIAPCPLNDPFYKYKATTELVAHMMMLRFVMHLPYYRFRQLLFGCPVAYQTLIGWARRAFDLLAPLGPCLQQEIVREAKLVCMDESHFKLLDTPAKVAAFRDQLKQQALVLEPPPSKQGGKSPINLDDEDMEEELSAGAAKGKVVLKGQMWALLNPVKGLALFEYSPSRATINALLMLKNYQGLLMADAYTVYRRLSKLMGVSITLLSCWAHARRGFLESQDPKNPDPVVGEVIARIAELYKIEKEIKGFSPRKKKKVRKRSATLLRALKKYLECQLPKYAPKEAVAQAIQYCLNHWNALSAYTHYGIAPIDNNQTERTIRPITVNRKNVLFLGSVEHAKGAALLYSLMECCRLQRVDPMTWLLDVMKTIETYPPDQLADLLPHKWKRTKQIGKSLPPNPPT